MTNQDEELRIAILGYGFSGTVFHSSLIDATEGARVAAIAEARPEAAAAARARFPEAAVVASADEVFARAGELDAVVVALPNWEHLPMALKAIRSGLAVIVDKPLAPSVAEAEELADAADAAGVKVTVFQNRRWDSEILTVRDQLPAAEIGQLVRYQSTYADFRPRVESGWREQLPRGAATGMVFDLGAHIMDQAVQIFGPVDRVYGEVGSLREGALVPDDFFVAVRHRKSGVIGHLRGSLVLSAKTPRITIEGTAGSIQVMDQDPEEDQLKAGLKPGQADFGVMSDPFADLVDVSGSVTRLPATRGAQQEFYRLWVNAMRGLGPLPVDIRHSIYALKILEAAIESSERGVTVAFCAPVPAGL
jgi:predicted dehydrogenase